MSLKFRANPFVNFPCLLPPPSYPPAAQVLSAKSNPVFEEKNVGAFEDVA